MDKRLVIINRTNYPRLELKGEFVMLVDNEFPLCLESNVGEWVFENFGMEFTEVDSYTDGDTKYIMGEVSSRNKKLPVGLREIQWLRVKDTKDNGLSFNYADKQIIEYLKDYFS